MSDDLKWTTNTHVTPFTLTSKAQLTISMVLEDPLLLRFFTRSPIFLPVHIHFYPSKLLVDESLHKAMVPQEWYGKHISLMTIFLGVRDFRHGLFLVIL